MFKSRKDIRTVMLLILFACFAASLFFKTEWYGEAIGYVWRVLSIIIAGLCTAFVMNIVMAPIEEKLLCPLFKKKSHPKLVRTVSIVATFAIFLGAVALTMVSIIPAISGMIDMVSEKLPELADSLPRKTVEFLESIGLSQEKLDEIMLKIGESVSALPDFLQDGVSSSLSFAFNLTTGIFGSLVNTILVLSIAVYAMAGKEMLSSATTKVINAFLRPKAVQVVNDLRRLMYEKFSEFFRGQIIEAAILGSMCFLGMLAFRFPNAGAVSITVAICAIIPIIGPWIGTITGTLLTLLSSPLQGLFFLIFILVLQQIEDNVFYPKIVGKSMGIPGILVMAAVVIGMKVAGMMGIIVAVPLSAVIYDLVDKYITLSPVKPEKKAEP